MRINIPKPCNENWNEMTPQQQGAFCKVCSKVVVDFSNMSDDQVLAYFESKKGERPCGRFRTSQLTPEEFKVDMGEVARQKSFPKIFASLLFLFFSSLFVCKSDTGNLLNFKISAINVPDTMNALRGIETVLDSAFTDSVLLTDAVTTGEPAFVETPVIDTIEPIILGGPVWTEVLPVFTDPDTTESQPPVTEPKEIYMTVGIVAFPIEKEMLKGKVKCERPTKKENGQIKEEKKKQKRAEKEGRIMGDLDL